MAPNNHFLASLTPPDLKALEPHLDLRELDRNDVLNTVGDRIRFAYLPSNAIISVMTVMSNGDRVETRTIGRESGSGLLHALGSRLAYEEVIVQVSGYAWRMPLDVLADQAAISPALVHRIVHHAQATLVQSAQSVACNALHTAEQKLCRWLLMTHDRVGADVVALTQEHLSIMVGVQRTTVTAMALELQDRGLISYRRGRIRILDRAALEQRACECYGVMTYMSGRELADRTPF